MARFLMNSMLASGGYPWTVIRVEDRDSYMASLEQASVNGNIERLPSLLCIRAKTNGSSTEANAAQALRLNLPQTIPSSLRMRCIEKTSEKHRS